MSPYEEKMEKLIRKTQNLIRQEKTIVLETVLLIGELEYNKAPAYFGFSTEEFAEKVLGLTLNQYWKRVSVARIFQFWPEFIDYIKDNKLTVSHVAAIAGRLTEANKEIILKNILGKTKREAEEFLRRVTRSGDVLPEREVLREVSLKLTEDQYQLLQRAMEITKAKGYCPREEEVVAAALDTLLEKKDPMRKALRAEKKRLDKQASSELHEDEIPSPGKEKALEVLQGPTSLGEVGQRRHIPRSIIHQVWLRDGGQCCYQNRRGERCQEKGMLEVDHIQPLAKEGSNELNNLRLLCRYHNQWAAEISLGKNFMEEKRIEARMRVH